MYYYALLCIRSTNGLKVCKDMSHSQMKKRGKVSNFSTKEMMFLASSGNMH